jgi:Transglutaminase-like superfamily
MNTRRRKWVNKWRRYKMRTAEERRLILRAIWTLPLMQLGLRVFGFRRWKELIEKFSFSPSVPQALPGSSQSEFAVRTAQAALSAELHGLTKPNCLARSMTLWWMLQSQGIDGELYVGARHWAGNFEAHAWVELDGTVLNDGSDVRQHYVRFDAPLAADLAPSHTKRGRKAD